MRPHISIRGCVRRSIHSSIHPSIHPSIHLSVRCCHHPCRHHHCHCHHQTKLLQFFSRSAKAAFIGILQSLGFQSSLSLSFILSPSSASSFFSLLLTSSFPRSSFPPSGSLSRPSHIGSLQTAFLLIEYLACIFYNKL